MMNITEEQYDVLTAQYVDEYDKLYEMNRDSRGILLTATLAMDILHHVINDRYREKNKYLT